MSKTRRSKCRGSFELRSELWLLIHQTRNILLKPWFHMKYSHWPSWILKLTLQPVVDSQKLNWHDNHVLILFKFPGSFVPPVSESSQCWLQVAQSSMETESGLGAISWNIIGEVYLVDLTFRLKIISCFQSCDCFLEQRSALKTLRVCGQIWGYSSLMSILTSYKCWHTIKECFIPSWYLLSSLTLFSYM